MSDFLADHKHIIQYLDLIKPPDPEKIRFPGGVITHIIPSHKYEVKERWQLVTSEHSNLPMVIKTILAVAYTSSKLLLDLARRSDYVVEFRHGKNLSRGYLLVKGLYGEYEESLGNMLLVPPALIDENEITQKAIISNPLDRFVQPPPPELQIYL